MTDRHLNDTQIQQYCDDAGSASVSTREHIHTCEKCREEVAFYHELHSDMEKIAPPELSPRFADGIMGQIAQIQPVRIRQQSAMPQWVWVGGLVAGAVTVTAVLLPPAVTQRFALPFSQLFNDSAHGFTAVVSEYLMAMNIKPITAVMGIVAFSGILLMDRALARVKRTQLFLSLMA